MDDFTDRNESRLQSRMPGGLTIPGIASIAAIALAIIGLSGVWPVVLLSIASIFLGIALFWGAQKASHRYSEFSGTEAESEGVGFNALTGLVGIVLGILSLIGVAPDILLPSAGIVFGCALLLESAFAHIGQFSSTSEVDPGVPSRGSMGSSDGINLLCGAAAVVLGILALNDYSPAVLTFVGFLIVGCANLLTGTTLFQRTTTAISRKF